MTFWSWIYREWIIVILENGTSCVAITKILTIISIKSWRLQRSRIVFIICVWWCHTVAIWRRINRVRLNVGGAWVQWSWFSGELLRCCGLNWWQFIRWDSLAGICCCSGWSLISGGSYIICVSLLLSSDWCIWSRCGRFNRVISCSPSCCSTLWSTLTICRCH